MNQNKMRAAITTFCGWKQSANGWWIDPADTNGGAAESPDWLFDLNAMAVAEKTIRNDLDAWMRYGCHLRRVADNGFPIDATASQRAEAFLRTISKTTAPALKENLTPAEQWPTDVLCRLILPVPMQAMGAIATAIGAVARKNGMDARMRQVGNVLEFYVPNEKE
jgi:hypothetical protein